MVHEAVHNGTTLQLFRIKSQADSCEHRHALNSTCAKQWKEPYDRACIKF